MFKNFYRLFINTKLGTIDLFDCLELAKKYGKVYRNSNDIFNEVSGKYVLSVKELDENEPVFIKVGSDAENYAVFYENFFITYSIDRNVDDYIVRIHMKRQEDNWEFKPLSSGDGCDVLHLLEENRNLGCGSSFLRRTHPSLAAGATGTHPSHSLAFTAALWLFGALL